MIFALAYVLINLNSKDRVEAVETTETVNK